MENGLRHALTRRMLLKLGGTAGLAAISPPAPLQADAADRLPPVYRNGALLMSNTGAEVTPDVPRLQGRAAPTIEGYAAADSVNLGATVRLHVRSALPRFDVHVWRMGWYGGAGGRRVASFNGLTGATQPTPTPDPHTGLVAAVWPVSLEFAVGADWKSGVYLAALHELGRAAATSYVPFIVRDDASSAPIVHQVATATWQAYNNWGGKSLYDYNSTQAQRAQQVSFDRPFASEYGAGSFFTGGDYNLILFYEREGYDVTYITSTDTETRAETVLGAPRRVFTTAWHDEYWSTGMRTALEAAITRGMSSLFFSSNNIYWRIRMLPSADGRATRVIACAKDASVDPETVLFRDATTARPENELLGSMYDDYIGYGTSFPWVVANSTHWIYRNTNLHDGDQITRLVGYEWDRTFDNGRTPPALVRLSSSPVRGLTNDTASVHEATIYQHASGATVFNAGTNYWAWLLSDDAWGVDERVRTMTRNLLQHATLAPPQPVGYRPVHATRILDTRGGPPVGPGGVRTADITRVAAIPATGVAAVICNLTITDPTESTYALAYANGTTRPDPASSVNAPAGATVANLVIVPPGVDRNIAIHNAFGSAHVIVDVVGWLPSGTITSIPATRVVDTRPSAPLAAGESRRIVIAGRAGVPASGAGSVVVNLTATNPTHTTYLLASAYGAPRLGPASSVNVTVGATVANLAVVGLSADGAIALSNAFGQVHVVLDVVGWTPAATVRAIDPVRILDTRNGPPLGPDDTRTVAVVGRAGVPAHASGVVVNLTLTDPTDATWVLAYPSGAPRPLASSVNAPAHATVANLAVVEPGVGGSIDLYNAAGRSHVIVDILGWFT